MGKAKKYKEQRKKERTEAEARRKKRNDRLIRYGGTVVLSTFLTTALVMSYNIWYPAKYWPKTLKKETKVAGVYKTGDKKYSKEADMTIDASKKYYANFETNKGNFKIELLVMNAPKTVNNFVSLAKDKYYDGLTFHRVIKDFMIQGGCPKGDGTGDPGYKFEDEINAKAIGLSEDKIKMNEGSGYKYNDSLETINLEKGVLAMANSGANTNGSQFFIITKDKTDWLDGKHTPFGRVIEGMDVVTGIEGVQIGENDRPIEPVTVKSINIEEK